MASFPTTPLSDGRTLGNPQNFWAKLTPQKLEERGYRMVKIA